MQQQQTAVKRSGELQVAQPRSWKSLGLKTYKPRHVVLRQDSLAYYKGHTYTSPKIYQPLALLELIAQDERSLEFSLGIRGDASATTYLRARSLEEFHAWMADLQDAMSSLSSLPSRRSSDSFSLAKRHQDVVTKDCFEMVEAIGEGGTAQIFKCLYKDKCYAMKVIRKNELSPPLLKQVHSEHRIMKLLKTIQHPNIVTLHSAFESDSELHLVMDYCPTDLFDAVRQKPAPTQAMKKRYVAEVASALNAMHCAGLIHNDLKVENILLDSDGHCKLADFGFSMELSDRQQLTTKTQAAYTPPDVLLGGLPSETTDWYALGCLIFELHHGIFPYFDPDQRKMMKMVVRGGVPASRHISQICRDLLEQLLHKDPEKRVGGKQGMTFSQLKQHKYFEGVDWDISEGGQPAPRSRQVSGG